MGAITTEGLGAMAEPEREGKGLTNESDRRETVFAGAFLAYYGRIAAVLFRLLGDHSQAEELASDVFVKLYHQPWLADSDGKVGGWLYRTATHLGIDALRAQRRRQHYEEAASRFRQETPPPPDALQEILREEDRRRVRAVLARLRPARAQILILRASGLSYNELAEALDVKRASVGALLARAEAEFQKRFLKMFGGEGQP